jgi:hypothetical protein
MIAEELPFGKTATHNTHSNRLTTMQGCETQCHILGMQIAAAADGDRIDSFSPVARSSDARAFLHNRRRTAESGGAVALAVASHLVVLVPHPSILIRQSVGVESGCVVAMELPTPSPTLPESPNEPLLPYSSTDLHAETDRENVPSFRPCVLLLEIPSFQTASLVLGCNLT